LIEKSKNVTKYLSNIDTTFFDINNYVVNSDICKECRKGELIPSEHEGVIICNNCGISSKYIIENDKPSYKEPPKEVCFYAYKRINHFREILAQFQAKESTQIPEKVIEDIKSQILSGNKSIFGVMLESNLFSGKQKILSDKESMKYGVSVTDGCIDWNETVSVIKSLKEAR